MQPALLPVPSQAGFPLLPQPRALVAAAAAPFPLDAGQSRSLGPPPPLPWHLPPQPLPVRSFRGVLPRRPSLPMTGCRRPPQRDVIVAAGSPAAPTPLGAPRGQSFRRRRPPRPPPSGQARPRPQLHALAAQSQLLQLPPTRSETTSSLRSASVASAQFALLILPSWPPPSAPKLAPPPRARPLVPAHQQSQPTPAPPVVNEDEVSGTPRDPDVDWWGVLWPHVPREGNWGTPPPSPPWGEPRPGDGAYQSRGMRLSEVGRCVTELSFVLDLLHYALQSREVVARDPQLSEDQQRRVRRAVSNALWDVLHLPLEPEDPLLDDGPCFAAFRMVATAAEESPPGIVPALACVLRWLGRRVERM
ncbi:unnamed protein product [Closterium sp. NIES-65]|nr:unnamed protein product [Closterium sp. NIES-65]